jgi:hypothetical protein
VFHLNDGNGLLLIDGRNRLEAMERAGVGPHPDEPSGSLSQGRQVLWPRDPVTYIISANIHRRHLTKAHQADLIVAAVKAAEKPPQLEEVSKGGRGKVNKVKAEAVKHAAGAGISKATVERAFAKAEGKTPAPAPKIGKVERIVLLINELSSKECEEFDWWYTHYRKEKSAA